jgi:phosphate uptake regulator
MGRTVPNAPNIRILQSIKGGSYIVSVPKWWVEKHQLKPGEELFTVEDGCSLRFSIRSPVLLRRRIELDLDRLSDMKSVRYCILTYYMQGAYEIMVKSSDQIPQEKKKKLREIRYDIPELEIMYENSNSIVFNVSTELEKTKIDEMVYAIHDMSLLTHRDAINALVENNLKQAREILKREKNMLVVYRRLIRSLSLCSVHPEIAYRVGIKDSNELVIYALLARDLHRIFYHCLYLARHFVKLGREIKSAAATPSVKALSELTYRMQELAVEGFIDRDFRKALTVTSLMEEVRTVEERLSVEVMENIRDLEEAVTLLSVARDLRRVAGHCVAIADATANRVFNPLRS